MLAKIAVADYMSTHIVKVSPDTDVSKAIASLLSHKITSMPVVDSRGKLVGLFSEKDGIRIVVESAYNQSMPGTVDEFMTRNPVVVNAEDSLIDVASKFENSLLRSFPVFQSGELVGMISRIDVLRALLAI
ncbi:MAG: CBS domain-containing protein [Methylomonas sp.]|nr:CBS domain-containing protein [Methylomonas sp.]PPD20889.1 MAG: signal transduction protein [Methylomonas sp.]PPD25610.1 MAG: signal transduction protein [Methylomonas sp.]PPD36611.1 MAG: signal transduction protein [Methylomonas sp.]PPD39920.1 MAG: signal transduction protein [Methylomonas sp.]